MLASRTAVSVAALAAVALPSLASAADAPAGPAAPAAALQGFAFGESLAGGSASTQEAGTEHPFAAPALRVGAIVPLFDGSSDALVEFDDREFAASAHATNCQDPLRSLACDERAVKKSDTTAFDARDWVVQEHAGVRVPTTDVYVDFANRYRASTYEKLDVEGVGFGIETLPPARAHGGLFGSALFFPNVLNEHGVFPDYANERPAAQDPARHGSIPVRFSVAQYELGATRPFAKRFFFDGGVRGDSSWRIVDAPSEGTKLGVFVGTGRTF